MEIKELTKEEFDTFTASYPYHSLYQTSAYAKAMIDENFKYLFLGLNDNGNIVGATTLIIQKYNGFVKAYAPRGFLIDYDNLSLVETFTNELKKYLSKMQIISIKLCPMIIKKKYDANGNIIEENPNYEKIFNTLINLGYRHYGYNYYFEALKPRFEAVLDINDNYINLFNKIKNEYQTKLRSGEKNGIRIYKGNVSDLNYLYEQTKQKYPRDLHFFENIYHEFEKQDACQFYYAKLNTEVFLQVSKAKYEKQMDMSEALNNNILKLANTNPHHLINKKINCDKLLEKYRRQLILATKLLKENPEGIILASALIIKDHDSVYLFMDGYNKKFKKLNAKHLLIWKLIEKYSKLNYKTFNLGGIADINSPNNKYEGLSQFKLNFGAYVLEYAGDFELVTNNTLYFMAKQANSLKNILKS